MADPLDTVNAEALLGQVLDGRYRIDSILGYGGFGVVFRGVQTSIGRPIALKTLHPQLAMAPTFFERFKREAEIASRLKHPNIITIYDFGRTAEGMCYFVMELLEGESLRERVRRDGPLTLREAAAVIEQIAVGVGHAHHQNVVHRDLKPHNIMLTEVDGSEYVKVLDFGLVKAIEQEEEEQLTSTGQVLGTPQYMPPEQAGGDIVDARSDLFSLTAVFYYCLTGRSPYAANNVKKALTMGMAGNVEPVATYREGAPVPEAVDRFLVKGLKPEKEDRFQSAEEFTAALQAAVAGVPDAVLDAVPAPPLNASPEAGSAASSASRRQSATGARPRAVSASRAIPRSGSRMVPAPEAAPKSKGLLIGVAALTLLLAIGGLAFALKGTPLAAVPPPSQPEPKAAPQHQTVKVTIRTAPDGAEVLEGEVLLGKTPLNLELEKGSVRTLSFKLGGYRELQRSLKAEVEQDLSFTLEPLASRPTSTPRPQRKKEEGIGAFE